MPAPINFTDGLCPAVQLRLADLVGPANPENKRTRLGTIEALESGCNFRNYDYYGFNGKYHDVQIIYNQRSTETDVIATSDGTRERCLTDGIVSSPISKIVPIQESDSIKLEFNDADLARLCQNNMEYMTARLNGAMDALLRKMNRRALIKLQANVGLYADASVSKSYTIIDPTPPGKIDYFQIAKWLQEYSNINATGTPIWIGGAQSNLFHTMAKIGCCNGTAGVDITRAADDSCFFYDQMVDSVIGANAAYLIEPGAVQLLHWSEFNGIEMQSDTLIKGTLVDPRTGMKFDLHGVYDQSCLLWRFRLFLWWDLAFIPVDVYAAGDPLINTRGTLRAQIS